MLWFIVKNKMFKSKDIRCPVFKVAVFPADEPDPKLVGDRTLSCLVTSTFHLPMVPDDLAELHNLLGHVLVGFPTSGSSFRLFVPDTLTLLLER